MRRSSGSTEREQFGKRIAEFQGVSFILADMATGIEAARSTYLAAARRRDSGLSFGPQASMAKLLATDMAMKVTIDAVQLFGGYGYTTEFPVERYMREAKVMQIFEGTNQIQRMVIGRHLTSAKYGVEHITVRTPVVHVSATPQPLPHAPIVCSSAVRD